VSILDKLTSEIRKEIDNIGEHIHKSKWDKIKDSISIGPSIPLGFGLI
jgi:hypothetical protein